jgi:hypothetical protein
MTTAKPSARYGVSEGARADGFALPSYTNHWGYDPRSPIIRCSRAYVDAYEAFCRCQNAWQKRGPEYVCPDQIDPMRHALFDLEIIRTSPRAQLHQKSIAALVISQGMDLAFGVTIANRNIIRAES